MQKVKTIAHAVVLTVLGSLLVRKTATVGLLGFVLVMGAAPAVFAATRPSTLFFLCSRPMTGYATMRAVGYVHTATDHRDTLIDLDCDSRTNGGNTYDKLPILSTIAGDVTSIVLTVQVVWHKPDNTVIAMSSPLVSTNNYATGSPIADVTTGNGEGYISITYP